MGYGRAQVALKKPFELSSRVSFGNAGLSFLHFYTNGILNLVVGEFVHDYGCGRPNPVSIVPELLRLWLQ